MTGPGGQRPIPWITVKTEEHSNHIIIIKYRKNCYIVLSDKVSATKLGATSAQKTRVLFIEIYQCTFCIFVKLLFSFLLPRCRVVLTVTRKMQILKGKIKTTPFDFSQTRTQMQIEIFIKYT